jgi:hypothetical protein
MSHPALSAAGVIAAVLAAALAAVVIALAVRRRLRRKWRLVAPEERADRAALRMLRETSSMLDADGHEPREVSFYLYFATRAVAERAAAQVASLPIDSPRLTVGVEPAGRGVTWLCLVTIEVVPSDQAIRRVCADLRALASANGGEFDGWEVALPW